MMVLYIASRKYEPNELYILFSFAVLYMTMLLFLESDIILKGRYSNNSELKIRAPSHISPKIGYLGGHN